MSDGFPPFFATVATILGVIILGVTLAQGGPPALLVLGAGLLGYAGLVGESPLRAPIHTYRRLRPPPAKPPAVKAPTAEEFHLGRARGFYLSGRYDLDEFDAAVECVLAGGHLTEHGDLVTAEHGREVVESWANAWKPAGVYVSSNPSNRSSR